MTNRGFSQRTPTRGTNNDGKVNALDIVRTPLLQNRVFRSPECKEIMQSADVNVSNPPFSLFREYIAQVMEYGKLFIIIGNLCKRAFLV